MRSRSSFFKTLCQEQLECRRTLAASLVIESSSLDFMTGTTQLISEISLTAASDDKAATNQFNGIETNLHEKSSNENNAGVTQLLSKTTHIIPRYIAPHSLQNNSTSADHRLNIAVHENFDADYLHSKTSSLTHVTNAPSAKLVSDLIIPSGGDIGTLVDRESYSPEISKPGSTTVNESSSKQLSMRPQFDRKNTPFLFQQREVSPEIDRSRVESFKALDAYFEMLERDQSDGLLDKNKQWSIDSFGSTETYRSSDDNTDVRPSNMIGSWFFFSHEASEFSGNVGLKESSSTRLYVGAVYPQLLENVVVERSELASTGDSNLSPWFPVARNTSPGVDQEEGVVTSTTHSTYLAIGSATVFSAYVVRYYREQKNDRLLTSRNKNRKSPS